MSKFVIGMGSSHPKGIVYIQQAYAEIANDNFAIVEGVSDIFKNPGQDTPYKGLFYNCALAIKCSKHPEQLLYYLNFLEHKLGRIRSFKNCPRTVDLDILLFNNQNFISNRLILPHKHLYLRSFFITPAVEAIQIAQWPLPWQLIKARKKLSASKLVRVIFPLS
jgi:2-amino-4-hydroxy-6-hydroxymethyldihydropteridine diphosphokinase